MVAPGDATRPRIGAGSFALGLAPLQTPFRRHTNWKKGMEGLTPLPELENRQCGITLAGGSQSDGLRLWCRYGLPITLRRNPQSVPNPPSRPALPHRGPAVATGQDRQF